MSARTFPITVQCRLTRSAPYLCDGVESPAGLPTPPHPGCRFGSVRRILNTLLHSMRIDRCICFGRTFEELLAHARECGLEDATALQESLPFGLKCGLCLPYVREALRSGRVVFNRVIVDEGVPEP